MRTYSSTGAIDISCEWPSAILVDLTKGHGDSAIIGTGRHAASRTCTGSSSYTSLWWAHGLGTTATKKTCNASCTSIAASPTSASATEEPTESPEQLTPTSTGSSATTTLSLSILRNIILNAN